MKIAEQPFFTHPGYKLAKNGPRYLDEAELLSIILDNGNKNERVLDISYRLLKKYNLNGLRNCSLSELKKEFNGDSSKALKILSLIELTKRYNKLVRGGFSSKPICSSKDVFDMFVDRFRDCKQEVLCVVLLDTKNKVIGVREVFIGTLNGSLIHPREIFKEAIKESANSIILVHNHPSGDPTPSEEDKEITERLFDLGEMLSIKVLDHLIIGKDKWFSFKDTQ